MKKVIIMLVALGIIVAGVFTRPGREDYFNWMREAPKNQSDEIIERGLVILGQPLLQNKSSVRNCIFFSIFTTDINGVKVNSIGIFNKIVPLKKELSEEEEERL